MKHECPVCGEPCECEEYELYGDCAHHPPYAGAPVGISGFDFSEPAEPVMLAGKR